MKRISPALLSVALLASPLLAQQQGQTKRQGPTSRPTVSHKAKSKARKFRQLELPGDQVAKNVEKLTSLKWHKTLGGALKSARDQKKPLLWIHALGDIDGYL